MQNQPLINSATTGPNIHAMASKGPHMGSRDTTELLKHAKLHLSQFDAKGGLVPTVEAWLSTDSVASG